MGAPEDHLSQVCVTGGQVRAWSSKGAWTNKCQLCFLVVVLLPFVPVVISKVFVYYPTALNFLKNAEHILLFPSHKDAALSSAISYIKDRGPLFETLFLTDSTLLSQ